MTHHYPRPAAVALLCILASHLAHAQLPTWAWGLSMGTTGVEGVGGLALDGAGNVYAIGSYSGPMDMDPGPGTTLFTPTNTDPFFLKLNAFGELVWAKTIAAGNTQLGARIALDPAGNIYLAGALGGFNTVDMDPGPGTFNLTGAGSTDVFVMKLDPAGDFLWAKAVGGLSEDAVQGFAVDANGHAYVCGRFGSTNADFDPGPGTHLLSANSVSGDGFVMELDTDGDLEWAHGVGGNMQDAAYGISVDDDGNVFLAGEFADTVDLDPGPGVLDFAAVGSKDVFITKYTTNGSLVWARVIGGPSGQSVVDLALDADANLLVTGAYPSGTDFDPNAGVVTANASPSDLYVLKLDSASNFQWVRTVGGTSLDYARGIDVLTDASGAVYVSGTYNGTIDADPGPDTLTLTSVGDNDVLLMKLDATGTEEWALTLQGPGTESAYGLVLNSSGSLFVAGSYSSPTLALGSITLNNEGGMSNTADILIARLDSTDLATGMIAMDRTRNDVAAYPVPFSTQLTVGGCRTNDELRLIDLSGRCVRIEQARGTNATLNTAALTAGVYVLEVRRGTTMMRSKVVKE